MDYGYLFPSEVDLESRALDLARLNASSRIRYESTCDDRWDMEDIKIHIHLGRIEN